MSKIYLPIGIGLDQLQMEYIELEADCKLQQSDRPQHFNPEYNHPKGVVKLSPRRKFAKKQVKRPRKRTKRKNYGEE